MSKSKPPVRGLRASFLPFYTSASEVEGTLIKEMGRGASPRRIVAVEPKFVVTENIKTGHRSRVKIQNLGRYIVVAPEKK